MTEFILALPLLLLVLALMLFMGWQMMRRQQVIVASRYTVWQYFEGSEGSAPSAPTGSQLNNSFLRNQAANVPVPVDALGSDAPLHAWVDRATGVDPDITQLVNEMLMNQYNTGGAHGRNVKIAASFDSQMGLWKDYFQRMNYMEATCGRDGLEWAALSPPEAAPWTPLRKYYYLDLDEALRGIDGGNNSLAQRMQALYDASWAPPIP